MVVVADPLILTERGLTLTSHVGYLGHNHRLGHSSCGAARTWTFVFVLFYVALGFLVLAPCSVCQALGVTNAGDWGRPLAGVIP